MRENREKLRLGIPVQPPVAQDKIEELMSHILPQEVEQTLSNINKKARGLPSQYTINQLLQSFAGYNAWMSRAAKGGSIAELTLKISDCTDDINEKASLLLNRGRRYMYEGQFELASKDFEESYAILQSSNGDSFDEYPRLLEWVGMSRHLHFDLPGALKCYEQCSDLEPFNVRRSNR
jgi:hypothetical protein